MTHLSPLRSSRNPVLLDRLGATGIWYKTYWIRNDLRFTYSLSPSPGTGVVELPGAAPQPEVAVRPGVPQGKTVEERIESKILKSERRRGSTRPRLRRIASGALSPYPVVVCFHGDAYISPDGIPTPVILDNLIAEKRIPPMAAIFVAQSPQPQRNEELSNNVPFAEFVADELLPQLRRMWRVTANPAETVVCGSSAGGLGSLFIAFHRPAVFGNVLAQSAALWRDHEWLTGQYEASPKLPIRILLQPGVLETIPTPGNGPTILTCNRHLRDVLKARGYELHYSEVAGAHEELTWRGGIAPGLIQLLGNLINSRP